MVVLVGYATDHGSTRGIAGRIGEGLRAHGVAVDVQPMTEVDDVGRYDAVVLGSAIHGGKWLLDGTKFVDRNAALLRERPVWLFSVSTLGDEESMFSPRVARRLCAMRKETPEVTIYVQPYVRASIEPSPERSLVRTGRRPDAPSSGPSANATATTGTGRRLRRARAVLPGSCSQRRRRASHRSGGDGRGELIGRDRDRSSGRGGVHPLLHGELLS
jgi:menaquinone-dependent protoporphyrinogen IX oxidase